jgi:hypothetical protein
MFYLHQAPKGWKCLSTVNIASGELLAAAHLIGRRNLWTPILAHGISDTIAVL